MIRARHFVVRGRVQGVGFRWFTARAAGEYDLVGFVRNLPDGTVEVHAQGEEAKLDGFKHELSYGPSSARVSEVVEEPRPVSDSHAFFEIL